jgi:hypothetical protein
MRNIKRKKETMQQKRSLFGPLLLIAVGAIWLLVKSGNIPSANLWALTHIWPFLLIAAGIGLILRQYWSYTSIALDILIVGGLVFSIVYAPQLKWNNPSIFSMIGDSDWYIGPGEPGSGNVITQKREVSNFHAIEVDYPAKVVIKQGNTESVSIEAEDNLMPNLRTEVQNGTLKIFYKKTNGKHVNPTTSVNITVTVKDLDEVTYSSAGELTVTGLKTDDLAVSLSGAGNFELKDIDVKNLKVDMSGAGGMTASGAADNLDLNISGFGEFTGEDLHGKTANVTISGAGNASMWVDNELDAEISGAGSIHYYGSPAVTKQINGLGSVDRLGDR